MKTLLQPGRDLNTRKLIQEAVDEYGRAYALGSRKSARAQVWVVPVTTTSTTTLSDESSSSTATTTATTTSQDNIGGEGGQIYINGVPLHNYFSSMHDRVETIKPLTVTRCLPVVNVWALVTGGGQSGQVGAVRVAIARALAMLDPNGVGEYLDKCKRIAGSWTERERDIQRKECEDSYGMLGVED